MLTVKHIRFDGAETIDHCQRVIFYPDSDRPEQINTPCPHWFGGVTLLDAIGGRDINYHDGVIYVMNDKGATISKYDLGAPDLRQRYPLNSPPNSANA